MGKDRSRKLQDERVVFNKETFGYLCLDNFKEYIIMFLDSTFQKYYLYRLI